jgi:hypothetical protein
VDTTDTVDASRGSEVSEEVWSGKHFLRGARIDKSSGRSE